MLIVSRLLAVTGIAVLLGVARFLLDCWREVRIQRARQRFAVTFERYVHEEGQ